MNKTKKHNKETDLIALGKETKTSDNVHIGSSNAFEETENPLSKDLDDVSDERLDELLDE